MTFELDVIDVVCGLVAVASFPPATNFLKHPEDEWVFIHYSAFSFYQRR